MRTASPLIFSILIMAASFVRAEADGPDYFRIQKVAANDLLHIRSAADPDAVKVGQIPPGADCVKNLGCKGGLTFEEFIRLSKREHAELSKERPGWCLIDYRGIRGWVAGRYLAEGSCEQQ